MDKVHWANLILLHFILILQISVHEKSDAYIKNGYKERFSGQNKKQTILKQKMQ